MGSNLSRVVFQPPEPSYTKDPNLIWLNTDQSEVIPAFYVPHKDAHFTLLFSHANAEDLGYINRHFREVSKQLKVNVFAYEYSGYGMSSGQATEKMCTLTSKLPSSTCAISLVFHGLRSFCTAVLWDVAHLATSRHALQFEEWFCKHRVCRYIVFHSTSASVCQVIYFPI